MNKILLSSIIAVAFIAGTLVASTPVSGAKGGALQEVWDAIFGLQTQIDDLDERLEILENSPDPPTPQPPGDEDVSIPQGSSVPGCEQTNACYIPFTITKSVGDTITWKNNDSAAHTVTSGTPGGGPDGEFDSSLILLGESFAVKFNEVRSWDYFCMVHPWMEGIVEITESSVLALACLYGDSSITDLQFVNGLQALIDNGEITPTVTNSPGQIIDPTQPVPSWIQNNSGWWCDDLIDDNSFFQGVNFLVSEGHLKYP